MDGWVDRWGREGGRVDVWVGRGAGSGWVGRVRVDGWEGGGHQ